MFFRLVFQRLRLEPDSLLKETGCSKKQAAASDYNRAAGDTNGVIVQVDLDDARPPYGCALLDPDRLAGTDYTVGDEVSGERPGCGTCGWILDDADGGIEES